MAARSAASCSARVGFGSSAVTRPIAASLSTPVGSPVRGSFTMTPFAGLRVRRVMPASFSAAEFAQPVWPSYDGRDTRADPAPARRASAASAARR